MRTPPVTGEPSPFIRNAVSFLINLVAGLIFSQGSHPVVDTNTDGLKRVRPKGSPKQ